MGAFVRLFDRYAPAMAAFWGGSALMAVYFGIVVIRGGSPIKPDTYGELVYRFPALGWAAIQLAAGLTATIGSAFKRARLAFTGGLATTLLLAAFGVLSLQAPHGTLLQAGAMVWTCPVSLMATMICAGAWNGRG